MSNGPRDTSRYNPGHSTHCTDLNLRCGSGQCMGHGVHRVHSASLKNSTKIHRGLIHNAMAVAEIRLGLSKSIPLYFIFHLINPSSSMTHNPEAVIYFTKLTGMTQNCPIHLSPAWPLMWWISVSLLRTWHFVALPLLQVQGSLSPIRLEFLVTPKSPEQHPHIN